MLILNETEFKDLVEKFLMEAKIKFKEPQSSDRKEPLLSQRIFYTLNRRAPKHIPDLLIQSEETVPCELKSSKEIYDVCHYSKAHLVSYFYQIIYGQCLSYADLFRENDKLPLKIYLIIPEKILIKSEDFNSVESTFSSILEDSQELIKKEMELSKISFSPPHFSQFVNNNRKYGKIGTEDDTILVTKIEYDPKIRGRGSDQGTEN